MILSLPVIVAFQIPSLHAIEFFGLTLISFAKWCTLLLAVGMAWCIVWMRTRAVHLRRSGLVLWLPFGRVAIPWKNIHEFEIIPLKALYPPEELPLHQQQKLGSAYSTSGVLLHLAPNSLGLKKWLLQWPMLSDHPDKLFLPVDDWGDLSDKLRQIKASKSGSNYSTNPKERVKRSTKLDINRDEIDILLVSAGNREVGQLIQQVEENYSIAVAQTGLDAVRIYRSNAPKLIVIDTNLPNDLTPITLIKSLNQYKSRGHICALVVTRKNIDPDLELELLEANFKEILILKRNLPVLIKRIDFWLDWQSQVANMAKRNQELYGQNLHQKSELARHGELMHFLPKDVAEEVIAGVYLKEAAHLRKQTVTVLFADIVGFTPLSAQLTPDTLAELLNDYLQRMTEVVVNHGGIVDKFIGDEVMAIFGAPEEEPETVQVQNAFSAALSMVEVVKAMDSVWQHQLPAELSIRAGINTGVCTTGLFGSESLRSYTVIGSPVNLAARLTSAAPAGGIATCDNSLKWVKMRAKYSTLGQIPLKGIVKPVEVYQILNMVEPDLIK